MFSGKGKSAKDSKEDKKGESLEKMESASIMHSDWEMPELMAKRKKDSVMALIDSSPDQAISVLRKWMLSDPS